MERAFLYPPLGRLAAAIKTIVLVIVAVIVPESSRAAEPTLCIAVTPPIAPGVTEVAVIAAVRERVAEVSVVPCRAANAAVWRVDVGSGGPSAVVIHARGDRLTDDQTLPVDEHDASDTVRQIAIAVAELMRPTLIAWFDHDATSALQWTEPPEAKETKPVTEAPAAAPAHPHIFVGVQAGIRTGRTIAGHVALVPEVRYRHWRLLAGVDGDLYGSQTTNSITSRFRTLELGGAVGRDLLGDRIFVGIGAQARSMHASIEGVNTIGSVSAWDVGGRVVAAVRIWHNDLLDVGVATRGSLWRHPLRVLYDGRDSAHLPRFDVVVTPYLAIALN